MTRQTRAYQWSVGIHGVILLALAVMQVFVVSQSKVTVIDFTLSGSSALPAVEQAPPNTEPARPRAIAARRSVPKPQAEQEQSPSQVSNNGEALPGPVPRETAGSSAASAHQAGTATAGSALSMAGSSGSGTGQTPEESRAAYLKEHFEYIRDRITKSISYPPMARKMGWCGHVKIAFVVCEDGGVNNVRVVDSSGFSLLDRNAVDTVKNVAPFPRPPVKAEIRMVITYKFN